MLNYSKTKKTKRIKMADLIFNIVNYTVMFLLAMIMIIPMIHVISISFSSGEEALKGGIFLYPREFTLKAYEQVFKDKMIIRSYINSVIYSVVHTVLVLFFTALTAYPLSVKNFCLRKGVTIYLTLTMFISGGTIPTYILMQNLKLINSPLVMMIPFIVGAYNVILFRTFFSGIDSGLRESARIDGASEMRILFQLIFPLSKAIFAVIGLFTFVGKWNDWYSALIYITEEKFYPAQMIIRKILFNARAFDGMSPAMQQLFRDSTIQPINIQMATIVIVTMPIICIYPFLQKYFAKGIMIGSIKG